MLVDVVAGQEERGVRDEAVSPHVTVELSRMAGRSGFAAARQVIEVHGPCARCGSDDVPA